MPDAQTHTTASALFLRLAELPHEAREAELASEPDPEVRTAVRALLRGHDTATGPLDAPLASLCREREAAATRIIGREVGPWRITARLGVGGMGAVYRAERADGLYEREVALKLLAPGAALAGSDWLARRLAAERRILARLEHPGIARLYDGGVTSDGLPYLAMELVDGAPITAFADAHALSIRDRVRLAARVAEAVAYAHQRLVVHRDLKPSNILVAGTGNVETRDAGSASPQSRSPNPSRAPRVKLLDFGIAKLLDPDAADLLTRTQAALTPAYAAPEQVTGGEITTATDVYALGVLLYELLAGRRPYDLSDSTAAEAERLITEAVPPPPSSTAPAERVRTLRGDLDTVVLKALEKEPARRYPTAQALADDLHRWLGGLAVEARPATAGYRLGRFVRRHRVLAGAAAAVLVAVVGGAGAALWQAQEAARERDRAEARFAVAQDAARAMLYDVHDAIARLPGATPARETIVARSLDYLDRLAADAGDAPALRLDLAGAYFRIANVQGNPTDNNLGRTDEALMSYRRGLALLPDPSEVPDSLAQTVLTLGGRLHEKLGVTIAHAVAPDSALPYLDRAIALQRRARALEPDDPDAITYLATAHINRADYTGHPYFPNAAQPDSALAHYARALALLEQIPEDRATLFSRRMHALTYEREGNLFRDRGDLGAAMEPARRALALRQSVAAMPEAGAEAQRDVGVSHEALGLLHVEAGRSQEGVRELRMAFAIYQELFDADPENVAAQRTLAFGHLHLGRALVVTERRAEGRRHLADAARWFASLSDGPGDRWSELAEQARSEGRAA